MRGLAEPVPLDDPDGGADEVVEVVDVEDVSPAVVAGASDPVGAALPDVEPDPDAEPEAAPGDLGAALVVTGAGATGAGVAGAGAGGASVVAGGGVGVGSTGAGGSGWSPRACAGVMPGWP